MNQHQLTMTRGDDREFAILLDDDYSGDTATLRVDGLFEKTATVDEDPGSGYSTATFTVDSDDTEDASDTRRAYRYEVSIDHDGATLTVRRGLFVVLPDLEDVGSRGAALESSA